MEGDNSATEEWYTYKIGDGSFNKLGDAASHPEAVKTATHVRIEASSIASNAFFRFQALVAVDLLSGLQEIGDRAFQYCSSLKFVSIPLTVSVIGGRAFQACSSLTTITIPKSTSIIRPGSFCSCSALITVNLPKDGTLEVLEDFLFSDCSELKVIHVPSSVKYIREGVFLGCTQLITIELPIGILTLGKRCFCDASELSNMIIPLTTECIEDSLFECAYEIRQTVLHPNGDEEDSEEEEDDDEDINTNLANAMAKRFDGLPLHTMCYYHTYRPMEKTISDIQSHSPEDSDVVDMFGMTSLHVLALSTEPKAQLFKALSKCVAPRVFTAKDKWGTTPIQWLLISSSPGAEESINFLIQHTIVDRAQWLGLDRWKAAIANHVDLLDLNDDSRSRHQRIEGLYTLLEKLELIESTSLVESVLWSIRIDEAKNSSSPTSVDREACRIHCGAETVISNVLQFLLDSTED